jgi:methylmalonyl-CoA mutase cobalamin-binding subunit
LLAKAVRLPPALAARQGHEDAALTDLSLASKLGPYRPKHKVRFVAATTLFDGHYASINNMRRILQSTGVEEIVTAALHKDAPAMLIFASARRMNLLCSKAASGLHGCAISRR